MKKIILLSLALCLMLGSVLIINGADSETAEKTYPIESWKANADKNTYYITKPEELLTIAAMVNDGSTRFEGVSFVMLNDIDMTGIKWVPIGFVTGTTNASTINMSKAFSGNFNGNGFAIKNLTVDTEQLSDCAGLFGCVDGGKVENLTINKATVEGTMFGGAVVGYARRAQLINLTVDGSTTVKSGTRTGGIAGGIVNSTISYCVSNATVDCVSTNASFSSYVGGVVGVFVEHDGNKMSYCVNNGTVTGDCPKNNFIGGLVGITDSGGSGIIEHSANNGVLKNSVGTAVYVGGIAGRTGNASGKTQSITDCVNVGSTMVTNPNTAKTYIGGIVGILGVANTSNTTVSNCKYDSTKGFTKDFGNYNSTSTNSFEHILTNNGSVASADAASLMGAVNTAITTYRGTVQKITVAEADMVTVLLSGVAGGDQGDAGEQSTTEKKEEPAATKKPASTTAKSTTAAATAADTTVADVAEQEKSGCGSTVALSLIPVAIGLGAVCVLNRKKENED